MKKSATKTYTVQIRSIIIADVEVKANTLEEAVEQAKLLELSDVVTFENGVSHVDSSLIVSGIYSQKAWDTEQ